MCRVRPELERLELPPQLLPGLNSGGVRSSSSPGDLIQLLIWLDLHVNIRLHFHDINIIPNISALCHRSLLEYLHKEEKRTAARWQLFAIQDGYTLLRSYSLAYFFFALNILQAEFIQINFWNPINNAPAICGQREGNAILKEQPVPVYYVSKHINPLSGVLSRSKNRPVLDWPRDRTTIVTNVNLLHFRMKLSHYSFILFAGDRHEHDTYLLRRLCYKQTLRKHIFRNFDYHPPKGYI